MVISIWISVRIHTESIILVKNFPPGGYWRKFSSDGIVTAMNRSPRTTIALVGAIALTLGVAASGERRRHPGAHATTSRSPSRTGRATGLARRHPRGHRRAPGRRRASRCCARPAPPTTPTRTPGDNPDRGTTPPGRRRSRQVGFDASELVASWNARHPGRHLDPGRAAGHLQHRRPDPVVRHGPLGLRRQRHPAHERQPPGRPVVDDLDRHVLDRRRGQRRDAARLPAAPDPLPRARPVAVAAGAGCSAR